MPQPVSGVPSPSILERTPLAMRDCSLRKPVSLRVVRCPWNERDIPSLPARMRAQPAASADPPDRSARRHRAFPPTPRARDAHRWSPQHSARSEMSAAANGSAGSPRAWRAPPKPCSSVLPSSTNSTSNCATRERGGDFLRERADVLLLVAHRNHDGDFGAPRGQLMTRARPAHARAT